MILSEVSAVDLGNSRAKMLIGTEFHSLEYVPGWEETAVELLGRPGASADICISSVNAKAGAVLHGALLHAPGLRTWSAAELIDRTKIADFTRVSGMGADRRLGLAGALSIFPPPVITIDCGTAITINVVDRSRVCRGGAIFPGVKIQAGALHTHTSALPLVRFAGPRLEPGTCTDDAILFGITSSILGGIIAASDAICRTVLGGEIPAAVITGGHSALFEPLLGERLPGIIREPHLVLNGIREIYAADGR